MPEYALTAPGRRRTTPWKRSRSALLALLPLLLAAGSLLPAEPAHADTVNGLLLWYPLNEASGTVATDSSGHGNDGTVAGTASWGGDQGLTFDGTDTYIKAPNNIMAGLNSITVSFDTWIDPAQATPYFLYGFGNTNTSNGQGNGYLMASGNNFRSSITTTNYTGEKTTSPGTALPTGTWTHVTYTQTGTTGTLYKDGVQVSQNTSISITPGAIGGGITAADFIGCSLYATDHYFKGKMRNFRVYDHALNAVQVQADAGAQWEEVEELAENNGALTAFEDPNIGPVIIFPSDYTGDINTLQHPSGWTDSTGATPTSWPTPTTAKSAMFTLDQIDAVQDAVDNAIQPDGDTTYSLSVHYDGMSDRVIAQTNAPSSITDPLATQYPDQLVIQGPPANTAPASCAPQVSLNTNPGNSGGETTASEQLQALADYNCALASFEDPKIGSVIIFPSDYSGDINNLQNPTDWTDSTGATPTSWPTPTTAKSVLFTAAKVQEIIAAAVDQIQPAGSTVFYSLSVHYDGMSDRIVVNTDAPSSVTNPLLSAYPGQITVASQTAPAMQIINKNSNLNLGVSGASTAPNGAAVQLAPDSTTNEQWKLVAAEPGYYKIADVNSGLLLGISSASTTAGAAVVQWTDNGSADQRWQVVDAGGGYVKLVNKNSGLLLGISSASTTAGATAVQWTDNGSADQQWQLTPVS
ncbi:RICIN domain-containing protein [Streptomyces sp. NPDC101175]|uniref:RICIN domain-containing protein n=1 Tax=Streptomyces sp. NPDC101175 TaxID=3366123 RepID=UPI0038330D06